MLENVIVFIVSIKTVFNSNSMKHWFRLSSGKNNALPSVFFFFFGGGGGGGGGGGVTGFLEVFRLLCILKCSGVFGVSRRCFGGVPGLLALLRNISTTRVRGFHQRFQTPRN